MFSTQECAVFTWDMILCGARLVTTLKPVADLVAWQDWASPSQGTWESTWRWLLPQDPAPKAQHPGCTEVIPAVRATPPTLATSHPDPFQRWAHRGCGRAGPEVGNGRRTPALCCPGAHCELRDWGVGRSWESDRKDSQRALKGRDPIITDSVKKPGHEPLGLPHLQIPPRLAQGHPGRSACLTLTYYAEQF